MPLWRAALELNLALEANKELLWEDRMVESARLVEIAEPEKDPERGEVAQMLCPCPTQFLEFDARGPASIGRLAVRLGECGLPAKWDVEPRMAEEFPEGPKECQPFSGARKALDGPERPPKLRNDEDGPKRTFDGGATPERRAFIPFAP